MTEKGFQSFRSPPSRGWQKKGFRVSEFQKFPAYIQRIFRRNLFSSLSYIRCRIYHGRKIQWTPERLPQSIRKTLAFHQIPHQLHVRRPQKALKPWNPETLKLWNPETLKLWNVSALHLPLLPLLPLPRCCGLLPVPGPVPVGMADSGECSLLFVVYPDLFRVDRGAGDRELRRGEVDIEGQWGWGHRRQLKDFLLSEGEVWSQRFEFRIPNSE